MTFHEPVSAFERAAARAVAEQLGREAPGFWALAEHGIGIHEADPNWAYVTVRVPVTLGLIVDEIAAERQHA